MPKSIITNKQFKIVSDFNLNNQNIINSIIDMNNNTIDNLTTNNIDNFNDIYNGIINYVNNSIIEIDNAIHDKQDKLIAGNGIIIENNIISSYSDESEIINLNSMIPETNIILDSNNTYNLTCDNDITQLNIQLNSPVKTNINNSILLHLYIGNLNINVNYGTDAFFDNTIIYNSGFYDILYVWNNLLNKYICNVCNIILMSNSIF